MQTRRIGIIMNGVTGRMGTNQHLLRSVKAIIDQGGVKLGDAEWAAHKRGEINAFSIGGLPDIVEHRVTGFLSPLADVNDLGNGLGRP